MTLSEVAAHFDQTYQELFLKGLTMSDLTVCSEEIPDWLTEDFFRDNLNITGDLKLKSVQWACAKGDNFASQIFRVELQFDDENSQSLIVKSRPIGGFSEEFVKKFNIFPKEIEMYQNVQLFEEYFQTLSHRITFAPK